MATIMPQGENIRKAVQWISGQVQEHPGKKPVGFVNEAVTRFDLSPKDAEFLMEFYRQGQKDFPEEA